MDSKAPIARTFTQAAKNAANLLATAAPAALMVGVTPALADTTVSTATTTPLVTSTAGAVTVASGGTIKLDTGTAVTVDASQNVTVASGGTLDMGAGNGAAGVIVNSGTTSNVSNAGTIQVLETFTPPDTDNNGIPEGPIAQATGRYGIRVAPGGTATGTISNTGTISVDGLNSAGIAVDSALTGSVTNTGTIRIRGDNSVGIRTGAVSGNVSAGGSIAVVGSGTQALVVNGDVGGLVKINGALSQLPSYTADSGATQNLPRSALSTGKAAVEINGNVAGGVIVTTASGSGTTAETTGTITSIGNGQGAKLKGVEVSIQAPFKFLPGFLSNFGGIANFTYVDSSADYNVAGPAVVPGGPNPGLVRNSALYNLSKKALNGTLYYEDSKFSARVSMSYRSAYNDASSATGNIFEGYGSTINVDASLRYSITENIDISVEGINLTDEYRYRFTDAATRRNYENNHFGRTFLFGARVKI